MQHGDTGSGKTSDNDQGSYGVSTNKFKKVGREEWQCSWVSLDGLQTVMEEKRGRKNESVGGYTKEELHLYAEEVIEIGIHKPTSLSCLYNY